MTHTASDLQGVVTNPEFVLPCDHDARHRSVF